MNQHGRRYEHVLTNAVNDVTDDDVWVTTAGYSGNAAADHCDMVITVSPQFRTRGDPVQYNIEAKKRQGESGKRFSAFSGSSGDESGLDELQRLVDGTPAWGASIVVLKVTHRKPFVLDVKRLIRVLEGNEKPTNGQLNVLQPRLTPSDNVSMVKPSTDEWPSAQASQPDEKVLCERLGVPYDE